MSASKVPISKNPPGDDLDQEIKVLSRKDDVWKVRIIFPDLESSEGELVDRMRQAKNLIAFNSKIPVELLELREILEKNPVKGGVAVNVAIGKVFAEKGKPVVHMKTMKAKNGSVFNDMIAEVSFHYLDEFDHNISLERINVELQKAIIDEKLCDTFKLSEAIERVIKKKSIARNLEIARGKLPESGVDAELEYMFFTEVSAAENMKEYRDSRKVKKGDILCQKVPAKDGKLTGFDVHGVEIPPMKGLDFQLVAGDGVELTIDGTQLKAAKDGIAIMDRKYRSVLTLAGEKKIPDKVELTVKPLLMVNAEDIENLVTDDAIEIRGTLKKGASINSQSEVYIEGDVEEGVIVRGASEVMIDGDIRGGEISSDDSVTASRGANGSTIIATNKVELKGSAENSKISARSVIVEKAINSEITASENVMMQSVEGKSIVKIGRKDFYRRKIESSKRAIIELRTNLERIGALFGQKIIAVLNQTNLRQILIMHLKEMRINLKSAVDDAKVNALKSLLESVIPMKAMIAEKVKEIAEMKVKMAEECDNPMVIIKEKIADTVDVSLNGKKAQVLPSEQGARIFNNRKGEIQVESLPING